MNGGFYINMQAPGLPFEIGKIIEGKDHRRVFVADVVYSLVEKDWLVIYHSLDEKDIIKGTYTLNLDTFMLGL